MRWYWATAIEPLLEAIQARAIVEVGMFAGATTAELVSFAERHGGIVHGIDPAPLQPAVDLAERHECLVLHAEPSLEALPRIKDMDAVLIDGDHNWFTVISELRLLARIAASGGRDFPLTFLHDMSWPYGRRDQYCDPAAIPEQHRQPIGRGGVWPRRGDLLDDGGMAVGGHHAVAEGTPRNGVRTAVEDFVSEMDGKLELRVLSGMHGLGILVGEDRARSDEALAACLARLGSPAWLSAECERLERARVMAEVRLGTLKHRLRGVLREGDRPGR